MKIGRSCKVPAKEMNKAQSVNNLKREKVMEGDAICKSYKRQHDKIKENKEKACSVAREEIATFLSLFDVVIVGDNDYRKWMQGVSHAASAVCSISGQVGEKDRVQAECDGWSVD
jgi:hypothetical protein